MKCPGSVSLIKSLALTPEVEGEEPEYRLLGTVCHEAISVCLEGDMDAWEVVGLPFHGYYITPPLAGGIQVFLNEARRARKAMDAAATVYIEYKISDPLHPSFYGRLDLALVHGKRAVLRDYKNGAGVVVEVVDNAQLMYYAYGLLLKHPEIEEFDLGIVQPNAFHPDGAVRTWQIEAQYIRDWAEGTMFPALERAMMDGQPFAPGDHCQFCPAKLACPVLTGMFEAAAKYDEKVPPLDNGALAREYEKIGPVKMYIKALEGEMLRRLTADQKPFEGKVKLVNKKADRVWKPEAALAFSDVPGAFSEPELLSPARIEALGPEMKQLVREYAYTPVSGVTVALWKDKRPAVQVLTTHETFAAALEYINANKHDAE